MPEKKTSARILDGEETTKAMRVHDLIMNRLEDVLNANTDVDDSLLDDILSSVTFMDILTKHYVRVVYHYTCPQCGRLHDDDSNPGNCLECGHILV